ncbi:transcriptional regulator PadR family protein (plasmid) [Gemmatirosa kalamazoonensis]|uniref:Transcriptional regulator PadR family protein n=1 Tax=Gemmatirosa kalamazoonensis TaxID=861299 RepID=W0RWC7_9BACT|nr:helix-turn-helix transcriptional regulator [Gemmatirosa kalamazoonensis]AHG93878.1 transcriptional regulator PadR family protein [Gemmatirosa kalamazoonensis]
MPSDTFLPLKNVDVLILTMLTAGERHGYGIRQDIIDHTDGALRLEAANLYRSIRRLTDLGFVDESGRRAAPDADDERRRYYRITAAGHRALAAEMLRLRALVRLAEARRLIPPEPA